jgi:ubiquinone/menaquinone biosynthesis C-methylase UbiE
VSEPPPVCDYEGSDYQARFWDAADRAYEDRVEVVALQRLMPPRGARLLEVGAGAGRNTERYPGYDQIVLLDYSGTQIAQARERLGDRADLVYVIGDAYRLPFGPDVFDGATMIRTLHHMVDPALALGQVGGVLAPGGAFVLEFANKRNLKSLLRWISRRQSWNPFDRAPVEFAALNFDFHPAAVRGWLSQAGFQMERQLAVSQFRQALLKRVIPLGALVWLDAMIQRPGGLWPLSPSVFVRASRPGGGPVTDDVVWRCPGCGGLELHRDGDGQVCEACGRVWGYRDGVHDFKTPVEGPPLA